MVCFPFKKEKVDVVLRNVEIAAAHEKVAVVLLVAASENETFEEVKEGIPHMEKKYGKKIDIQLQRRVGELRCVLQNVACSLLHGQIHLRELTLSDVTLSTGLARVME